MESINHHRSVTVPAWYLTLASDVSMTANDASASLLLTNAVLRHPLSPKQWRGIADRVVNYLISEAKRLANRADYADNAKYLTIDLSLRSHYHSTIKFFNSTRELADPVAAFSTALTLLAISEEMTKQLFDNCYPGDYVGSVSANISNDQVRLARDLIDYLEKVVIRMANGTYS